ncbi:MAG: T9SS type A sorting domain-containing protein [Bacteroidetes bacterium]|nr:T9SS type A sorting domain-containing protein [Bacteroidota bacterium]
MKKILFSLATLGLSAFSVKAQITVTSSDYIDVSSPLTQYIDTNTTITPGSAGANADWNFTALHAHDTIISTFTSASSGLLGSNYTNANVCMHLDTNYFYFDTTSTKLDFYGVAGDLLGNSVNNAQVYSNPQTIITFPSTYFTAFTDTAAYDAKFVYGALYQGYFVDSVREKETIITSSTIDGWGTVHTPHGGFYCLRQNIVKHSIDSTWAKIVVGPYHYWISLFTANTNTQSYSYVSNTAGPIVDIEYYADSNVIYQVKWNSVVGDVGVSSIENQSSVNVFPNPSQGEFSVAINAPENEDYLMKVIDMTGRIVYNETLHIAKGKNLNAISVEGISEGLYMLQITASNGSMKCLPITITK